MVWKFMPTYKHWEWRVGTLLMCVENAGPDPDEGEWWNWNLQNREDNDVVTDERYEVVCGGAPTEAEAKTACEEVTRSIIETMLKQLAPTTSGKVVELYGRTWLLMDRKFMSDDKTTVGYNAIESHENGHAKLPAVVHYVEFAAEVLRGHDH